MLDGIKRVFFSPKALLDRILQKRAEDIVKRLSVYLNKQDKILDLGSGSCHIAKLLQTKGYDVTAVDIKNSSFFEDLKPVIYNGKNLPFVDQEFSVVLLITVLHHTPQPESIITEAQRVASRLLIIEEDIYSGMWQKYITFFIDSLLNFEFFGHPHTNKTDSAWRAEFKRAGLRLKDVKYHKSHIFLHHATYILEK